jgi:hypothetical protein
MTALRPKKNSKRRSCNFESRIRRVDRPKSSFCAIVEEAHHQFYYSFWLNHGAPQIPIDLSHLPNVESVWITEAPELELRFFIGWVKLADAARRSCNFESRIRRVDRPKLSFCAIVVAQKLNLGRSTLRIRDSKLQLRLAASANFTQPLNWRKLITNLLFFLGRKAVI